jgi:hypothetical protein
MKLLHTFCKNGQSVLPMELHSLLQTVYAPYITLSNFLHYKNKKHWSKHTSIFQYANFCWALFQMEHAVFGILKVQKLQFLT